MVMSYDEVYILIHGQYTRIDGNAGNALVSAGQWPWDEPARFSGWYCLPVRYDVLCHVFRFLWKCVW